MLLCGWISAIVIVVHARFVARPMVSFGIVAGVVVQYRADMAGVVIQFAQPPDNSGCRIEASINTRAGQNDYAYIFVGIASRIQFTQCVEK